jgi:SAM-dependent methyltransferase
MGNLDTDRHWERWGQTRPYVGVLATRDYDDITRGDPAWTRFMETGEAHTREILDRLVRLGAPSRFDRALDFGCGVGRILAPLAAHCDAVVGVDVSAAMRAEAVANMAWLEVDNVEVAPSDDALSQVTGTFDLVHSYNVFQHITARRGLALTQRLLALTRPGGAVAFHYCESAPTFRHRSKRIIGRSRIALRAANRWRGRPAETPVMQMLPYRFEAVAQVLKQRGVEQVLVDWQRYHRNTFFFIYARLPS